MCMDDIFFFEQGGDQKPPAEVQIEQLTAQPMADGKRIKVALVVTPFLEKPNLELEIVDSEGRVVSSADILETMTIKMELTMHIRSASSEGEHTLRASLYYREQPVQHTMETIFTPPIIIA